MSTYRSEEEFEAPRYYFGEFIIDVPDRQLWRGGKRIELNARYLDALVLLVRETNQLVEKDRFFDEVWTDVVVSDSALTQCIKEIRKQLGDDASNPRFIQTVPGHGYRFVGDAKPSMAGQRDSESFRSENRADISHSDYEGDSRRREETFRLLHPGLDVWWAGALGGGFAGLLGGMLYGFGLASADGGVGTLSTLFVLISLTMLVGLTGGFGVSFGLAGAEVIAHLLPKTRILVRIIGAAFGGLFIGALAKLLGVDAFNLFFGRAPAGITGGPEGAVLGAALALGAYVGNRIGERPGDSTLWRAAAGAGFAGALSGALIPAAGGRLLGGSLDLLAKSFAESNLQLDSLGSFFGELHFGYATQVALGSVEGLLFGSCVVGAIGLMARHKYGDSSFWKA